MSIQSTEDSNLPADRRTSPVRDRNYDFVFSLADALNVPLQRNASYQKPASLARSVARALAAGRESVKSTVRTPSTSTLQRWLAGHSIMSRGQFNGDLLELLKKMGVDPSHLERVQRCFSDARAMRESPSAYHLDQPVVRSSLFENGDQVMDYLIGICDKYQDLAPNPIPLPGRTICFGDSGIPSPRSYQDVFQELDQLFHERRRRSFVHIKVCGPPGRYKTGVCHGLVFRIAASYAPGSRDLADGPILPIAIAWPDLLALIREDEENEILNHSDGEVVSLLCGRLVRQCGLSLGDADSRRLIQDERTVVVVHGVRFWSDPACSTAETNPERIEAVLASPRVESILTLLKQAKSLVMAGRHVHHICLDDTDENRKPIVSLGRTQSEAPLDWEANGFTHQVEVISPDNSWVARRCRDLFAQSNPSLPNLGNLGDATGNLSLPGVAVATGRLIQSGWISPRGISSDSLLLANLYANQVLEHLPGGCQPDAPADAADRGRFEQTSHVFVTDYIQAKYGRRKFLRFYDAAECDLRASQMAGLPHVSVPSGEQREWASRFVRAYIGMELDQDDNPIDAQRVTFSFQYGPPSKQELQVPVLLGQFDAESMYVLAERAASPAEQQVRSQSRSAEFTPSITSKQLDDLGWRTLIERMIGVLTVPQQPSSEWAAITWSDCNRVWRFFMSALGIMRWRALLNPELTGLQNQVADTIRSIWHPRWQDWKGIGNLRFFGARAVAAAVNEQWAIDKLMLLSEQLTEYKDADELSCDLIFLSEVSLSLGGRCSDIGRSGEEPVVDRLARVLVATLEAVLDVRLPRDTLQLLSGPNVRHARYHLVETIVQIASPTLLRTALPRIEDEYAKIDDRQVTSPKLAIERATVLGGLHAVRHRRPARMEPKRPVARSEGLVEQARGLMAGAYREVTDERWTTTPVVPHAAVHMFLAFRRVTSLLPSFLRERAVSKYVTQFVDTMDSDALATEPASLGYLIAWLRHELQDGVRPNLAATDRLLNVYKSLPNTPSATQPTVPDDPNEDAKSMLRELLLDMGYQRITRQLLEMN